MNPTLSERARRRRQQVSWRVHPPTPFALPAEPELTLPVLEVPALAAAEPMAPAALQLSARPSASGGPLLLLLELLLVLLDGWFALGELLAPWITNHLRPAKSRVGLRLVPLPELVRPGSLSAIHY